MTTIHDLNKAFKGIPNSPLAKTHYDKMWLVCNIAMSLLADIHAEYVATFCVEEVRTSLNVDSFEKHGLPNVDSLVKYPDQRSAIVKAATCYIRLVHESPMFTDLLTELHAQFLSDGDGNGLGQHFTPFDLAALVGALSFSHMSRHGGMKSKSIYDPACGAGGLILGTLREVVANSPEDDNPLSLWTIAAADIDPLCSMMTALQLFANRVIHCRRYFELKVRCENSLTLEGDWFFYDSPHSPEFIEQMRAFDQLSARFARRAA